VPPAGLERVQLENAVDDVVGERLPDRKRLTWEQLLKRIATADDHITRRRIAEPGKHIRDRRGTARVAMLEHEPPSFGINDLRGAELPAAENADDLELEAVLAIDAFDESSMVDGKLVTRPGDDQKTKVTPSGARGRLLRGA
jgi:hypothetical protein